MLNKRLEWFIENRNLFSEETTGFRKTKSSLDNLSNLITRIQLGFGNDCITLACFIDIKNAYNNLDIACLLLNLDKLGVGSKLCKYLWTYLKERWLSVQSDDDEIISRVTGRGIAQGDPLSPLLFNIATLHICQKISNVVVSQYADDYVLYVTCKHIDDASKILQLALDQIYILFSDLGLEISPTKTKICIFKKGINRFPLSLNINKIPIDSVDAVKYLGMWLDRSLKWNVHISELLNKLSRFLSLFKVLAGSSWGIHPKHLRKLYISIIRSRLDYGSFLYNNSSIKYINRLDKAQNQSLRVIGGFIKTTPIHAMESELCLPPLHVRRTYLGAKYILKAKSRKNNVTINLLQTFSQVKNCRYWRNKKKPLLLTMYEQLADIQVYSCSQLEMFALNTWMNSIDLSNIICLKIPNLTIAKRNYNVSSLKLICDNFIRHQYENSYKIYTDASKDKHGLGAAFIDPQCNINIKFKISSNICIMEAELVAISEAVSYSASLKQEKIVIFTDSKSALQHLARCTSGIRGTPTAYIILNCILGLTSSSKSIVLQWIPSHCGIDSNEHADMLAKQAAGDGIEYRILPFYSDCLLNIKQKCYKQWKEYFDLRSKDKGIWYKTIQPQPCKVPWIDSSNLSRRDTVVAMRLRCGHIPSNKFAFLMGKLPSPNCDVCGVPEDIMHILMECIRNNTIRQTDCKSFLKQSQDCNVTLYEPLSENAKRLYKLYNSIFIQNQH